MTRRPSITSIHNERLKTVRRLQRRRSREAFFASGRRDVAAALDVGAGLVEVFAAPELFVHPDDVALVAEVERRGARVVELSASAFCSIARDARPDGLAALVRRPRTDLSLLRGGSLLLVAEAIERPGNLGTIVRTACGAGADGLIVCDARTDLFHPDTIRGAVGTILRLPLAESSSEQAIAWLREHGHRVVVATPAASRPYFGADYARPLALVVGNERSGVSDAWLRTADQTVAVPMPGPTDSLNVAVAAGIVLFEAARR